MRSKASKPAIVRQIDGGYFQAANGSWWLLNEQRGWLEVKPEESRALRFYMNLAGVS